MHAFWAALVLCVCANLITDSGDELKWAEECRHLGAYLVNEDLNAVSILQSARFIVHLLLSLAG